MKTEHPAIVELRRRIMKGFEEKTLRAETILKHTARMEGKTEEEIAQIAEEILLKLTEEDIEPQLHDRPTEKQSFL